MPKTKKKKMRISISIPVEMNDFLERCCKSPSGVEECLTKSSLITMILETQLSEAIQYHKEKQAQEEKEKIN